jgi:hypothetical protein
MLEGNDMTAGKWLVSAALALGFVPTLARADYWRYETETGSLAFTDDAKNIPAKYRAGAKQIAEESLFTYPRLSIVSPDAYRPTPRGVADPNAAVPVFPWPAPAAGLAPQERDTSPRVSIDVEGVRIDVDPNQEEPIYIDKRQYVNGDGEYIDHGGVNSATTIVRQGDKELVYIDER